MERVKFYIWCPKCEKFHEYNELRKVDIGTDQRYFCPESPRDSEALELAFTEMEE